MELEKLMDAKQTAEALRKLADAIENKKAFQLEKETIQIDEKAKFEWEYEVKNGKAELELEIKWFTEANARQGKIEIFTGKDEKHYFHVKATNGEIILASEAYTSKQNAIKGAESVVKNAKEEAFELRTSRANQPYFVMKAGNGEIIGVSQMYKSKKAAQKGIVSCLKNLPEAEIISE